MKKLSCPVKSFFVEPVAGFGMIVGNNGENVDVPESHVDDFVKRGLVEDPRSASPLDHDGDGEPGGRLPADPPALAGKNKTQLLEIAEAEGVEVAEDATKAVITEAIEAKRAEVAAAAAAAAAAANDAGASADGTGNADNAGSVSSSDIPPA